MAFLLVTLLVEFKLLIGKTFKEQFYSENSSNKTLKLKTSRTAKKKYIKKLTI